MDGAIAFSAHVVEQVEATDAPLTSSDWGAARAAASDMMAFATLLTTPNNNAIDTLRRQDGEWRMLAKAMQDAGGDIAAASRKQDRAALKSSVTGMREACKTCHARYGAHGQ
jgi:cytochrome c556